MIIIRVDYSRFFVKHLKKLPKEIVEKAIEKEKTFKENPLHPSLRLHELHGKFKGIWSISINKNYRIIFERMQDGVIVFHSIGSHDIYKNK